MKQGTKCTQCDKWYHPNDVNEHIKTHYGIKHNKVLREVKTE